MLEPCSCAGWANPGLAPSPGRIWRAWAVRGLIQTRSRYRSCVSASKTNPPDRFGTTGTAFELWADALLADLDGNDHDALARAVAAAGRDLLGLAAEARKAARGEEDALWWLPGARRVLAFEVKLAPKVEKIVNDDVEQAEGATRALEQDHAGVSARGLLITPHGAADASATARLERLRLMKRDVFVGEVKELLRLLRRYRSGWSSDAGERAASRAAVEPELPALDWLWQATSTPQPWVDATLLQAARARAG